MKTIQELAQLFSAQFEGKTRDNGETFRMVKEGEHEETLAGILHACHKALGDCLPNDWVYSKVENALEAIAGGEEAGIYADSNVDIYNNDLKQWILHPFADEYLSQAFKDLSFDGDLYRLIGHAQYLALLDIHAQVYAGLEDLLEE